MKGIVPYVPQLHAKTVVTNDSKIFDHNILIPYEPRQFRHFSGWVSYSDSKVIGACLYSIDSSRSWYFAYLGVLPEYQRKGIGTKLLCVLLEKADKERAYLECHPAALNAKELFERHGFTVSSTGLGTELALLRRRPAGLRRVLAHKGE